MKPNAANIEFRAERVHGLAAIRICSAQAEAVVLVGKGADLISFRCRKTGAEMLAREPRADDIARRYRERGARSYGDCYLGGWPSLLPSRARRGNRASRPSGRPPGDQLQLGPADCGEAATVPFEAREMQVGSRHLLSCVADLARSGLRVTRTFAFNVVGKRLTIRASVTNIGPTPIEFHWTEHPTLGGDLLAGDFEMLLPGCEVMSSDAVPCTLIGDEDLRRLRTSVEAPEAFRTLRQLDQPWCAVFNPALRAGVHLSWDGRRLPHAWYWQALREGRRSLAIEPSNSFRTELVRDDPLALRLRPGRTISTRLDLTLIAATRMDYLRSSLTPRSIVDRPRRAAEVR